MLHQNYGLRITQTAAQKHYVYNWRAVMLLGGYADGLLLVELLLGSCPGPKLGSSQLLQVELLPLLNRSWVTASVAEPDPEPDPVGSELFSRIRP